MAGGSHGGRRKCQEPGPRGGVQGEPRRPGGGHAQMYSVGGRRGRGRAVLQLTQPRAPAGPRRGRRHPSLQMVPSSPWADQLLPRALGSAQRRPANWPPVCGTALRRPGRNLRGTWGAPGRGRTSTLTRGLRTTEWSNASHIESWEGSGLAHALTLRPAPPPPCTPDTRTSASGGARLARFEVAPTADAQLARAVIVGPHHLHIRSALRCVRGKLFDLVDPLVVAVQPRGLPRVAAEPLPASGAGFLHAPRPRPSAPRPSPSPQTLP
jgi:hypothetical protein